MKKVGLIAGMGELPIAIATDARSKGYNVVAVGLEPLAVRTLGHMWMKLAGLTSANSAGS